jgi:serine/threonine protein kinase
MAARRLARPPCAREGAILLAQLAVLDLEDPFVNLPQALVGQVLPGTDGRQYPLRDRLGEGGQGWVFRATWNGSVDVVVKVLRPDTATSEALARFQREAQVLRALSQQPLPNPHVVRFYDHAYARVQIAATGRSWDLPFTVLELVDGETLEHAIAQSPGGIGLERSRRILRHTVLALEDVHARNIIHRDLKPSNILLARAGHREIAKVTDFGLAKLLDPGMSRTTHLAGATVGYAPPEQFENGNLRVGRPTDVFSLAAIFYEMVTGKPAFPIDANAHPLLVIARILTESPPALARAKTIPRELAERPDVVAAVDAELSRALSSEPGDRHPTATAFFEAVERSFSTFSGTPSIPAIPLGGRVVVRPSSPPGAEDFGLAATIGQAARPEAPSSMTATAAVAPAAQGTSRDVARAETLVWQRISPALLSVGFRAIAIAPAGGRAVALGLRGPAQWARGQWTRLDLPPGIAPGTMRAVAWYDERIVVAGGAAIVTLDELGRATTWRLDPPGIVLHGAFVDGGGVVLVGERPGPSGPLGIVAEVPNGAPAGSAARVSEAPGCGALRAAIRFAGGVLACGDAGALVLMRPAAGPPRVVKACPASLTALRAAPDGSAVVVGTGGFAFRVSPSLDAQLDAMQTTRDLFAVTAGPDGSLWCGGDAGRVLRRVPSGWIRVGTQGADARVVALHASSQRVLAFCDDGSVFEGTAP